MTIKRIIGALRWRLHRLLYRLGLPFQVHGVWVWRPPPVTPLTKQHWWSGHYERQELDLIAANIAPADRVLELGAGMGITTARINRLLTDGQLTTFEASPLAHACARRTLGLNGMRNVDLRHGALTTEQVEAVPFYIADEFLVNSLLPMEGGQSVDIPAHPLEQVLEEVQPDAVVMDIEGGEYALLAHPAWKRCRNLRTLIVEFHPSDALTDGSCDLSYWFESYACRLNWEEIQSIRNPTTVAFRMR